MKKRIIRILSVIMMLALLLPTLVPFAEAASGKYYTDINDSTEVGAAVNYLYEHGIMNGTGNNKFSPKGYITRGQLVTVMWRMLGKPPAESAVSFKDCGKSNQYYSAVQWAQSVGIAAGYTDGTFRPNQNLTNQELYVFMLRFVRYCGYKTQSDADLKDAFRVRINSSKRGTYQTYAIAAAGWVNKEGLLNNSKLAGNALCTRSDVALLVYNIYKKYQQKYALSVARYDSVTSYRNRPATDKELNTMLAREKTFFEALGAKAYVHGKLLPEDERPHDDQTHLSTIMDQAFGKARKLDICYFALHAHGAYGVIALYEVDTSAEELSAAELRGYIDRYDGMFVVMINACHSGSFIDTSRVCGKYLTSSHRIKVLCSSEASTESAYMFKFWARGAGFDIISGRSTEEAVADIDCGNQDGRVSLRELQTYIDREFAKTSFHPVCYPKNDDTIIFEYGY